MGHKHFCAQGFTPQYSARIVRAIDDASGRFAQMVKLVDTPASGVGGLTAVEVRVFFWAPSSNARLHQSSAFQKPAKAGFCVFRVKYHRARGPILLQKGFTPYYDHRIVRAIDGDSLRYAQVVKLVDTPASGVGGFTAVEVRVFSWAPNSSICCKKPT
jgi:hypothetical protein